MVVPESDWKNQPRDALDLAMIALGVILLAVHLYLWWVTGLARYVGIVLVLFAWLVLYFSKYWQPILYLVIAAPLLALTAVWLFQGAWERPSVLAIVVLNLVFALLGVYLSIQEEYYGAPGA